jgi:peptide/nickel transport system substrate-binding protein
MHRRRFLKTSLAATVAMPSVVRAQGASVIRFVPYADVATIDPTFSSAYAVRTHALLVWDTLYGVDERMQPQPQMVEGHRVEDDGRRWTLTLRDSLVFHDGSRVLARDCVASLKRWGTRDAFGQSLMAATDELSADGDKTIVFRLKRPFPLLPAALARPSSLIPIILPERLAVTDAYKQIPEAVGSGPFRYLADERVSGARHVYARHNAYVPRHGTPSFTAGPRRPLAERIEFTVMPDPAVAVAAMQSGSVDMIEQPLIDLLPVLRRTKDVAVEIKDPSGMCAIVRLNHTQPPFNNPAIRRIILKGVNQRDCMSAVAGNDSSLWRDKVGFFSATSAMSSDAGTEAIGSASDLGALRKELAEAGYKGERVVFLSGQDVPRIAAVCEVVADIMRQIGMNVDFVPADWGTVQQRILKKGPVEDGGWSGYVTYWGGLDLGSPASNTPIRGHGARASAGWPDSPALEAIRERWLAAGDPAEQKAIAREMQLQALVDVPYVPAGQYFQPIAYRRNLKGIPVGVPQLVNVEKV